MTQGQLSLEDFAITTAKQEAAQSAPQSAPQSMPQPEVVETKEDPQIFTVSDLNKHIRQMLEGNFGTVWLKGEISNFKPHSSGHYYFSLKDSAAQINAVMFRGFNQKLKFRPDNGMEVVVKGRVTVYEPRGTYQIFCEIMEPVGLGALQMAFEQLKAKLKSEGLFEAQRKKPLPFMPKKIAIVTSPTGAAIRDMLNVLSRRARGIEITIIPAIVQGAQAPADIIRGIERAQALGIFDVLIVGRGGGSMEDLWAFNDEGVARAIAGCRIPTISAVGHEVDFTIADFVADLRAPTPSAAAELVVRNTSDLLEKLKLLKAHLVQSVQKKLIVEKKHLLAIQRGLVDPKRRLQDLIIRCDEILERLVLAIQRKMESDRNEITLLASKLGRPELRLQSLRQQLELTYNHLTLGMKQSQARQRVLVGRLSELLDSLSPLRVVARGYSLVLHEGNIVKAASELKVGQKVRMQFATGTAEAEILKVEAESDEKGIHGI